MRPRSPSATHSPSTPGLSLDDRRGHADPRHGIGFRRRVVTPITQLLDEIAVWHGITMVEMLDVLIGPPRVVHRRSPVAPRRTWRAGDPRVAGGRSPRWPASAGLTLRGDEYKRSPVRSCSIPAPTTSSTNSSENCSPRATAHGLLTNSFKEFHDHLEAHVDFDVFDVVVDPLEVGLRKLEPEIYALTTKMVGGPTGRFLVFRRLRRRPGRMPRPPDGRRST